MKFGIAGEMAEARGTAASRVYRPPTFPVLGKPDTFQPSSHRMYLLESQLHRKIVNLLFTITNQDIKLTILWES